MLHRNQFAQPQNFSHRVLTTICVLFVSAHFSTVASAQTPTPTPITKPDPPTVQTPSTVGRITKWTGASKNGIGIIGDSIMTESGGNIGIGVTNPIDKLTVDGAISTTGRVTAGFFSIGSHTVLAGDISKFNLFAGNFAGPHTTGYYNAFFGMHAGRINTSGGSNSFFGSQAGFSNTTGNGNAFFGTSAGFLTTTGLANSFFGTSSGYKTDTGSFNAFFGGGAGGNNTLGSYNSFFGTNAGLSNSDESYNTFIGVNTNGAAGISNATALGANAVVTQSNSVVLGNNASVGIGTSAPQAKLHVIGSTAGQFDGNVTFNGNIAVSGTANLTATNAILATTATTADSANSLANTATVNGNQVNGALTNATIAGTAISGDVEAIQVSGNLVNATMSGNNITTGTVVKALNGLTDNVTLTAGDNVTITPSGNSLTISASGAGSQSTYNPLQVAQLRWWEANQSGASFAVGNLPTWVTFDGSHMWVANANDGTVSKIRSSDGASLGTFAVGVGPRAIAFDGKNIWVANFGMNSNAVTKLNAATGETIDSIVVGSRPFGLAFDGTYMWVSCYESNTVVKVRASDNQIMGSVSVASPLALAFDGTNIWAALNLASGRAAKISGAGSPTVLGEFNAGVFPGYITFDGANIWVSNSGSGNLTKLRAVDGLNQGTFQGGGVNNSGATVFDGTNLWVIGGSLLKLRPTDGQVLASFPITGNTIAFDGAHLWVTDLSGNTVTKR